MILAVRGVAAVWLEAACSAEEDGVRSSSVEEGWMGLGLLMQG